MKHVLGLSPAADAVGFEKIIIRPQAVAGVTWARGNYQSLRGPVRVVWQLTEGQMKLSIELPEGVTAGLFSAIDEDYSFFLLSLTQVVKEGKVWNSLLDSGEFEGQKVRTR